MSCLLPVRRGGRKGAADAGSPFFFQQSTGGLPESIVESSPTLGAATVRIFFLYPGTETGHMIFGATLSPTVFCT